MPELPATLSSGRTFWMKVIFPVIWIGAFAGGTLSMFLAADSWKGADGGPVDSWMKWLFLGLTLFGAALIWWTSIRLKRVRMDHQALYISNYVREIVVPLSNVAEVIENRWINIHPVTVRFHTHTEFGTAITFMPKVRPFAFWSSHPVVAQIREAAARNTGQSSIRA
jgi:hypothetical protein